MKDTIVIGAGLVLVLTLALFTRGYASSSNLTTVQKQTQGSAPKLSAEIHDAVKTKDLKRVKDLLKSQPSLANARDDSRMTPLMYAVKAHNVDMVKLLLKHKAEPTPDTRGPRGAHTTPLHIAADAGDAEIVKCLVDAGANVNATRLFGGGKPITLAAIKGHKQVGAILLAQKGIQVDVFSAAAFADLQIVKDHLDAHPDHVKAKAFGTTMLHCAAAAGRKDVVQLLVQRGADVNCMADWGMTPLYIAALNGRDKVVGILLVQNANVNSGDTFGRTALHRAAGEGHEKVVKKLLEQRADVDTPDASGMTPLHFATLGTQQDVAEILLLHGATVNRQDQSGKTPLHWACELGHAKVVELLLEKNANAGTQDKQGKTPLNYAEEKKNAPILKLLGRYTRKAEK